MADSPPPNSTPQLATTIAAPATPAPTRGGEPIPAIPGFDILGVLGRGGMGVVYKAREIALDRVVALKMIHSPAADAEERARFQVEARAAAKLHHQGIVQVHAVSEHDSRPFLVLEYVEGGTLASKLKGKPVAPRQAAGIVEKLARAVQTAHEAGVVHRDLKPANVLVTARWEPKIADFGLAKCLDSVHLTQTGAVLGTPAYMAPEQAAGRVQDVGPASDVYSLGAILYELLTGKTPFQGTDKIAVLRQVQHERPTPVSSFASVSKDLETICLKCLEKRPDDRYNSAFALADDLARFGRGEPIHARPIGVVGRGLRWARRRPALVGLVAAIVLLAALVPFVFWLIDALRGKDVDLAAKEDEARKERERAALFEAQRKKAEEDRAKLEGATEAERLQRRRGIAVQKAKAATSWVAAPQQAAQLLADEAVWPAPLRDDSWKAFELASRFDRNQVAPLGGQILQVVYSPDGKYYAAAVNHQYWLPPRDRGGLVAVPRVELRLMELTTGKLIAVLPIADHSGLRAAFSPDSKFVAIGGGNANAMGSVLIVETATGKSREQSFGPGSYLRGALHLSAEGRKLTFVDPSGIQTIDLKTGAREPTFNPWLGLVDTGAFSPDGQRFAPLPIIRVPLPNDPVVPVRVLERNRKDPREYRGPAHGPVALAFSADGKQIAAVCHQASVRFNEPSPPAELWVWDVESGKGEKVASWQVGVGPLQTQIAFLPEGTRIAAYVATGKSVRVSVHDVSKKTEVAGWQVPLDGTEVPFATVSYLPGEFTNAGCSFILSDRLGNVRRFDTLSGKLLASSSPAGHSEGPACYAFSSRAGLLATGSNDQEYPTYTIRLWQAATGKELHRLDCGPIPVAGLAFSADGTKLASVGHGRSGAEACLWDVVTGKQLWRKELTAWGTPRAVCFKPDGQQVAVAGGRDPGGFPTIGVPEQTGGSVLLLACTDGKQEGERKGHKAAIDSVAYSPDGTMLYTGAGIPKGNLGLGPKLEFAGGEVIEWKLSDDKWRRTHDNLPRVPLTLAVTDDGRTLIAAYVKVLGVVEFWETVVKD